jgi:exopolysaccharide production protein ExoQ
MSGTLSEAPRFDKCLIIPILACVYAAIGSHLMLLPCSNGDWNHADYECVVAERLDNRLFWPTLTLFAVAFIIQRRARLALPVHVVWLLAFLGFAGASVLWAFAPATSFIRYLQQVMIIICVVFPAIAVARKSDLLHSVFLVYAFAAFLNFVFVFIMPPLSMEHVTPGYAGYFAGKNYLGQLAGVAFLLSVMEIFENRRRPFAIVVAALSIALLLLSNSKTSLALALFAPVLATLTLVLKRWAKLSPAILPVAVVLIYMVVSSFSSFNVYKLSYLMYGESTFTGRAFIWDFATYEIEQRPFFGWGYQSFWQVGPSGPAKIDGPGWIKEMPHAHNGFLDIRLEVGYIGFAIFLGFLLTTLHACGRLLDLRPSRGWSVLSLAYFVIVNNFLESTWMRGSEFVWVVFLIIVAELARCGASVPPRRQRNIGPVSPARAPKRGVVYGR